MHDKTINKDINHDFSIKYQQKFIYLQQQKASETLQLSLTQIVPDISNFSIRVFQINRDAKLTKQIYVNTSQQSNKQTIDDLIVTIKTKSLQHIKTQINLPQQQNKLTIQFQNQHLQVFTGDICQENTQTVLINNINHAQMTLKYRLTKRNQQKQDQQSSNHQTDSKISSRVKEQTEIDKLQSSRMNVFCKQQLPKNIVTLKQQMTNKKKMFINRIKQSNDFQIDEEPISLRSRVVNFKLPLASTKEEKSIQNHKISQKYQQELGLQEHRLQHIIKMTSVFQKNTSKIQNFQDEESNSYLKDEQQSIEMASYGVGTIQVDQQKYDKSIICSIMDCQLGQIQQKSFHNDSKQLVTQKLSFNKKIININIQNASLKLNKKPHSVSSFTSSFNRKLSEESSRSKRHKTQKITWPYINQFYDLLIKNFSLTLQKRSFGSKFLQLSAGSTTYVTSQKSGNNLIWVNKQYTLRRVKAQNQMQLRVMEIKQGEESVFGQASVCISQLLLTQKQGYYQSFIIHDNSIVATAIFGFEFIEIIQPQSSSLPRKLNFRGSYKGSSSKKTKADSQRTQGQKSISNRYLNENGRQRQRIKLPSPKANQIRSRKLKGSKNIKISKANHMFQQQKQQKRWNQKPFWK